MGSGGQESLGTDHGIKLGLQDLDRDLEIVLQVLGEMHGRHPALPDLALDAVAIGDHLEPCTGRITVRAAARAPRVP